MCTKEYHAAIVMVGYASEKCIKNSFINEIKQLQTANNKNVLTESNMKRWFSLDGGRVVENINV